MKRTMRSLRIRRTRIVDLRRAVTPAVAVAALAAVMLPGIAQSADDISSGQVHNNVRRAHRGAVSLLAFLAIPKSV